MDTQPPSLAGPFALPTPASSLLARAAFNAARPALSRFLGLEELGALYELAREDRCGSFEARALRLLKVTVKGDQGRVIPIDGPVIVAANHPTGVVDGLALMEAVRQSRQDVRLLANHVLARIPELSESCFFVDPFGGPDAETRSVAGMRSAHLWLRRGGALLVFPAGEVAWRPGLQCGDGTSSDSPWHPSIGRLALATRAPVVPAYLDGRNSPLFYAAGRAHRRLRTVLLGRELLRQRSRTVSVSFGAPVRPHTLMPALTPAAATALIRSRADALATAGRHDIEALGDAVDPLLMQREIEALPGDALLLNAGQFEVLRATAEEIPATLREIGRLRECAFRDAGEGTGRAFDLDRFDHYYDHLFVWNRAAREVVGSYRIGATDRVIPEHGPTGLYTSTLFRYDAAFLRRFTPALELGRSFVRSEYQRSYTGLLLLWRGLGQIVARAPRYRLLFGPVSISSRYSEPSQRLLRAYLARHRRDSELPALVGGVHPPPSLPTAPRHSADASTIDDLDQAIREIEGREGIPVLLRQYLKLDATLLGFNVDPAFGGSLDALMSVDLARVSPSVLSRYLGAAGTPGFLAFHRDRRGSAEAAA